MSSHHGSSSLHYAFPPHVPAGDLGHLLRFKFLRFLSRGAEQENFSLVWSDGGSVTVKSKFGIGFLLILPPPLPLPTLCF